MFFIAGIHRNNDKQETLSSVHENESSNIYFSKWIVENSNSSTAKESKKEDPAKLFALSYRFSLENNPAKENISEENSTRLKHENKSDNRKHKTVNYFQWLDPFNSKKESNYTRPRHHSHHHWKRHRHHHTIKNRGRHRSSLNVINRKRNLLQNTHNSNIDNQFLNKDNFHIFPNTTNDSLDFKIYPSYTTERILENIEPRNNITYQPSSAANISRTNRSNLSQFDRVYFLQNNLPSDEQTQERSGISDATTSNDQRMSNFENSSSHLTDQNDYNSHINLHIIDQAPSPLNHTFYSLNSTLSENIDKDIFTVSSINEMDSDFSLQEDSPIVFNSTGNVLLEIVTKPFRFYDNDTLIMNNSLNSDFHIFTSTLTNNTNELTGNNSNEIILDRSNIDDNKQTMLKKKAVVNNDKSEFDERFLLLLKNKTFSRKNRKLQINQEITSNRPAVDHIDSVIELDNFLFLKNKLPIASPLKSYPRITLPKQKLQEDFDSLPNDSHNTPCSCGKLNIRGERTVIVQNQNSEDNFDLEESNDQTNLFPTARACYKAKELVIVMLLTSAVNVAIMALLTLIICWCRSARRQRFTQCYDEDAV